MFEHFRHSIPKLAFRLGFVLANIAKLLCFKGEFQACFALQPCQYVSRHGKNTEMHY